jgi:biotin carboxyl carrier protein
MNPTSRREVKLNVNGKSYVVEVGDLSTSPVTVTVNGHPYLVNIETALLKVTPADVAAAAPETIVRKMSAPEKAHISTSQAGPAANVVRAPLPGSIVEIFVKPGDKVSYRQQLCSIEAMKMNNVIHSTRDGVIASVEVTKGMDVVYGDVLFTFE